MKPNTVFVIVSAIAISFFTGCSAIKSEKPYCAQKGRLIAHIYNPQNYQCRVDFKYRNLSRHIQKPIIDITAYDDAGKVVTQHKIRFPELGPGVTQDLPQVLTCDNERISKIYVNDAVDAGRCYGYSCSSLCDIKATTIELTK